MYWLEDGRWTGRLSYLEDFSFEFWNKNVHGAGYVSIFSCLDTNWMPLNLQISQWRATSASLCSQKIMILLFLLSSPSWKTVRQQASRLAPIHTLVFVLWPSLGPWPQLHFSYAKKVKVWDSIEETVWFSEQTVPACICFIQSTKITFPLSSEPIQLTFPPVYPT